MQNTMPGLIVGGLLCLTVIHLFIILLRGELRAKKLLKELIKDKLTSTMYLSINEKIQLQGNKIFFVEETTCHADYQEVKVLEMIELIRFSKLGWHVKISPWLQAKNSSLFEYFEKFV